MDTTTATWSSDQTWLCFESVMEPYLKKTVGSYFVANYPSLFRLDPDHATEIHWRAFVATI
jgi:hypothetical protein